MAETVEDRRAALVERLADAITKSGAGCIYGADLAAEAVLAALDAEDSEAADERAEKMLAATGLAGLHVEDGSAVVDVRPPHELVVAMASAMAETLGDAPNYRETEFVPASMAADIHPAGGEWFVLTVQRKSGKTPGQLKAEADAEVERLRAQVAELESARFEHGPVVSEAPIFGGWQVRCTACEAPTLVGLPDRETAVERARSHVHIYADGEGYVPTKGAWPS